MEIQLTLDRSRRIPIALQIAHHIRDAIFSQQIAPGAQLPPTRELAGRLKVSRMVIVEAYEWLIADGYAETRPGSGTFAASHHSLPPHISQPIREPVRRTDPLPDQSITVDFRPGLPALDLFPRGLWNRALTRALDEAEAYQLGYGPVEGLPRLRHLIAAYAARTRGLPFLPEQVIVTVGAAQAFDLILRSLAPVQRVAVENPGSEPVYRLLQLDRIDAVPISVDSDGMRVADLPVGTEAPPMAYVMPSHQYPTGWTMSLDRRMELLAWARNQNAILLEDDYDSEFRYDRQPPVALAALDQLQQVVYIGTFSKTMFPGLRLGYCIVPERHIAGLLDLKWFSDRCVPIVEQLALASWLETGTLERHIRKMRSVYARRRALLMDRLQERFGARVQVSGVNAGMHLLLTVQLGMSETELREGAARHGVQVYAASPSYLSSPTIRAEVILGFGNLNEDTIERGVDLLATAWNT